MEQHQNDISKDDILRVLDQYIHVRKDREIMAVYLTDYPGSLERLAEECDVSKETVKRAIKRCAYIWRYLPGDELKVD